MNSIDQAILEFDRALRTVFGRPRTTGRVNPADATTPTASLSDEDKTTSGRLMRINHCGEVCAQALYQGQALTARDPATREAMQQSADEENDHLAWCSKQLKQLNTHPSYLNPLWYAGSFALGAASGLAGDKWSLGFLAETEKQVVAHLDEHLQKLPESDQATRAVLEQMKQDEASHATKAIEYGAAELPKPVCDAMGVASQVMKKVSYWL